MPYGQSPWMDASEAVSGTAQNMNHVALAMAGLKYKQALQAQRDAIAMGRLALQGKVDESLIGMHNASARNQKTLADLNDAKLSSANDLSDATRRLYPVDMSQGPTRAGASQMTLGDIAAAAEKSRALFGKGVDPFGMHNIPPNNVAVSPMTGELRGQGATEVNLGQMVQMPGALPVLNPRVAFAPPGSTPMSQGGQPLGPQTGFRPGQPEHMGNIIAEILKSQSAFGLTDPRTGATNAVDPAEILAYQYKTNALDQALKKNLQAPVAPSAVAAPVQSTKVRVKAPDGRTGMMDANDTLPQGWEVIQ